SACVPISDANTAVSMLNTMSAARRRMPSTYSFRCVCHRCTREPARRAVPRAGNRQSRRQGGRLQGLAPPLGDRAHILLAPPQSHGPLPSPRHVAVGFAKLAMIGVMLKRLTEVAS